jgi:hypothetical protein
VSYREHAPPPALRPWLECTWQRVGDGGPPVRVVPDGCIDLLWIEGSGTHVLGANTTAFLAPLAEGMRVAGARMRPGAAPALLGIDAEAVRDLRLPVQEIWGEAGDRLAAALEERERHIGALLGELSTRARGAPPPDPLVGAAISRLGDPEVGVRTLAGALAVSDRQLRRRFTTAVGYGRPQAAGPCPAARSSSRRRPVRRRSRPGGVRRRVRGSGALHQRMPRSRRRRAVGAAQALTSRPPVRELSPSRP